MARRRSYFGRVSRERLIYEPDRYEVGGHAMGRGRAKAKQTKVARDLKYNSQDIDLEKLSKELHGEVNKDDDSDDFDPYAEGNFIPRR